MMPVRREEGQLGGENSMTQAKASGKVWLTNGRSAGLAEFEISLAVVRISLR